MSLFGLPIGIEEFLIAIGIIFFITMLYKVLINQNRMRELKEHQKHHQQRIKELQNTNPEEAKKAMNDMLKLSNEQMRMTMKPMLITLVISLLIILPVMGDAYGDKVVSFEAGSGELILGDTLYSIQLQGDSLSIDGAACDLPCGDVKIGENRWDISLEGESAKFSRIAVQLPFSLPYFGNDFGWLAWYFILSLPLNTIIRKILGVEL